MLFAKGKYMARSSGVSYKLSLLLTIAALLTLSVTSLFAQNLVLIENRLPGPVIPYAGLSWVLWLLVLSDLIYTHDDVGSRALVRPRRLRFSVGRFITWFRYELRGLLYAKRHIVSGAWWATVVVGLAFVPQLNVLVGALSCVCMLGAMFLSVIWFLFVPRT